MMKLPSSFFSVTGNKLRDAFVILIAFLHFLFSLTIVIGTAFFREIPVTSFHQDLFFSNIVYYGLSIILIGIVLFSPKRIKRLSNRKMRRFALFVLCSGALLTIAISLWIPRLYFYDPKFMWRVAVDFPSNLDLSDDAWYFRRFPYQLNVTTLFGIIYYLTHKWGLVILCGGFLVFFTCYLVYKTVLKSTGNYEISVISLAISLTMLCFSWSTYLPYTDNWGMIFPAIMFYIFYANGNNTRRILFIVLLGGVGYLFKQTTLIPCIAILTAELLFNYREYSIKNACVILFAILLSTIIVGIIVPKGVQRLNHLTANPDEEYRMSYFFYLGQNAQYGVNNVEDVEFSSKFTNAQERKEACVNGAIQRIAERGFYGNLKFYVGKLIVATGDGLFSTPQGKLEWMSEETKEEVIQKRSSFPGSFLIKDGQYFQMYVGLEQVLWNLTLLLMLASCFFMRDKLVFSLSLTFIGYLLYILIFENRAKYLFMPLPLFVMLASITIWRLRGAFMKLRKTNSDGD